MIAILKYERLDENHDGKLVNEILAEHDINVIKSKHCRDLEAITKIKVNTRKELNVMISEMNRRSKRGVTILKIRNEFLWEKVMEA